ncbi:MAG: phosphoribosyltransferase family protein [Methanomicrobiales archaeon]|nr:phosphoribosyltransferase family protein [Methanomicrobiales archaeon]MDI6875184.1 phosphoribosyltransferase family protein [Methanomicrobiales archaeon]
MGRIVEDPDLRNRVHVFVDRADAGRRLAAMVREIPEILNPVVCAIPSGGVPIGLEVARTLNCPLNVAVVRKVHVPWNPESGFGAVAWDGRVIIDEDLANQLRLNERDIRREVEATRANVQDRVRAFSGGRPVLNVEGRDAVITDDGLAAGYTMVAAIESIRSLSPARIIAAVPTGPPATVSEVAEKVDVVVCPNIRSGPFFAVAEAYEHWHDLTEGEVMQYLRQARAIGHAGAEAA